MKEFKELSRKRNKSTSDLNLISVCTGDFFLSKTVVVLIDLILLILQVGLITLERKLIKLATVIHSYHVAN